jgi:3-oxoacyl-[acyl-carrier-protein] synthase-3
VIEAAEEPGIIYSTLGADGRYRDLLYASSGVSIRDRTGAALRMKGNEVFKVAVKTLENLVDDVIEKNRLEKGEIDWLIPHQANIRIINATAKRLQIPMERVVLTVREHGNTSAASVPLALDLAVRDGRIKPGDLVLMEALGGGLTWGAALVRL